MAHALAGRRGEPGNVGDHRRGQPLGDEGRGLLLVVPTDLADQHHGVGLRVGVEPLEGVDESEAVNGVSPDPDARRLADASGRHLVHDLVRQRAAPRHEAHPAGDADLAGDDPHVGLPR